MLFIDGNGIELCDYHEDWIKCGMDHCMTYLGIGMVYGKYDNLCGMVYGFGLYCMAYACYGLFVAYVCV